MSKNKKILTAGIWLYGLSCVASNQQTNSSMAKNVVCPTSNPIVIQDVKNPNVIKSESGFKQLSNVVSEAKNPIKVKAKVETKTKATATPKPEVKKSTKKSSATKTPSKVKSSTNITTSKLYNTIPLSSSFQKWIDEKCQNYGLSTNVVMGVIKKESNFNITVMGDHGEAYGLMQVQKKWHMARMYKVGAKNLLNCYDNVAVGIDFLAELYKANGGNWHKTLMAYNGGQGYANKRCGNGLFSSDYSRKVMEYAESYKKERN